MGAIRCIVPIAVILLAALPTMASAAETARRPDPPAAPDSVAAAPAYALDVCPVSGEPLGAMGEPVSRTYGTREVRFCCASCIGTFEEDLDGSLRSLDSLIVARQGADYPLTRCIVSGEVLGSHGAPADHVNGTRLYRLCCPSCAATIDAHPAHYAAVLDSARARAAGTQARPQQPDTDGSMDGQHHRSH